MLGWLEQESMRLGTRSQGRGGSRLCEEFAVSCQASEPVFVITLALMLVNVVHAGWPFLEANNSW